PVILFCLLRSGCVSLFLSYFFLICAPVPRSTLFPYTTLFRSATGRGLLRQGPRPAGRGQQRLRLAGGGGRRQHRGGGVAAVDHRSEEHTSELQSRGHLVCRLLLEKKK